MERQNRSKIVRSDSQESDCITENTNQRLMKRRKSKQNRKNHRNKVIDLEKFQTDTDSKKTINEIGEKRSRKREFHYPDTIFELELKKIRESLLRSNENVLFARPIKKKLTTE